MGSHRKKLKTYSSTSLWSFAATSALQAVKRGTTRSDRLVADGNCFVAFTIRRKLIRVISVRDMNRREHQFYGKHEEAGS